MISPTRTLVAITAAALSLLSVGRADAIPLSPADFTSLGSLVATAGSVFIDTGGLVPTLTTPGLIGERVFNGILLTQGAGLPDVAVFTFDNINVNGTATLSGTGNRPLVLLSKSDAVIQTNIGISATSGILGLPGGSPGAWGGNAGDIANGDIDVGLQGGRSGMGAGAGNGAGAIEIGAIGAVSVGPIFSNGGNGYVDSLNVPGGGGGGGAILLHGASVSAGSLQSRGGSGIGQQFGPVSAPSGPGGRILIAPDTYQLGDALPSVDIAGGPAFTTSFFGSIMNSQPAGPDGVFEVRPGRTVVGSGQVLTLPTTGKMALPAGGTLYITGIDLRGGAVVAPLAYATSGLLTLESGGFMALSTARIDHAVSIAGGSSFTAIGRADATATIALGGGTFSALGGLWTTSRLEGRGSVIGLVSGSAGSELRAEGGTLTVGDANRNDAVAWQGSMTVVSRAGSPGTMQLNSANQIILADTLLDGAGARLVTLNGARIDAGKLMQANAASRVWGELRNDGIVAGPNQDAEFLSFDDLVTGTGIFQGNVRFAGGFSPGASPALVDVGTVEFGAANTLRMELGGLLRGSQYDAIDATGTITLGGALDVVLLSLDGTPFMLVAGASFDLLRAKVIGGSFSAQLLPLLDADLQWRAGVLADGGNDVFRLSVTAVPEPSQWLLLLGGGALLLWQRRRFRA